jgi:hypothetical protein
MKSRKKILAGMVAMALGGGAYAATFEGRLACDQDPREAATSCMLYVPVTDTVGLPVYTQQISVTYLLEPRGAAAAGMDSESSISDIQASARALDTESSSQLLAGSSTSSSDLTLAATAPESEGPLSEPPKQASSSPARQGFFSRMFGERDSRSIVSSADDTHDLSINGGVYASAPWGEPPVMADPQPSRPGIFSRWTGEHNHAQLSTGPSRPGFFNRIFGDRERVSASSAEREAMRSAEQERTSASSGLDVQQVTVNESTAEPGLWPEPPVQENPSPTRIGLLSRLTGEREPRSTSAESAQAPEPSPDHLVMTESSEDPAVSS